MSMACSINTPWHRYALVAELTRRLERKSPWFGKTALQKLVYILQEAFGVDCGYRFQLYTHGPFTSQLLADLDLVESFGAVRVNYVQVPGGYAGYKIAAATKNDAIRSKGEQFIDQYSSSIDKVVDQFGSLPTRDLELRATIIYADKDAERSGNLRTRDEFIALVKGIKPRFSESEISDATSELEKNGHVIGR
jgi:uncharacterized protein